jgi:EF hand
MKMRILAAALALASTPTSAQTDQHNPAAPPGGAPAAGEMMPGVPEQCRALMQGMPSGCMEMMRGGLMGSMRGHASTPAQSGAAGTLSPDMMGHGMMMRGRGGHMKLMLALVDTDGDGALSFDEITAVHRRIFNTVDANKDGKVTREELQVFMQEW